MEEANPESKAEEARFAGNTFSADPIAVLEGRTTPPSVEPLSSAVPISIVFAANTPLPT